jgi:CheY-like chemotaxis protein
MELDLCRDFVEGGGMKRILLLDDSQHIQKVVRIAFEESAGFQVVVAKNGAEAAQTLQGGRIDVIIAYVHFDKGSPIEFFQNLKGHCASIVLLAESSEDISSYEAAGFHQILRKPFVTGKLQAAVRDLLGVEVRAAPAMPLPPIPNAPKSEMPPPPPPPPGAMKVAPPPPPPPPGAMKVAPPPPPPPLPKKPEAMPPPPPPVAPKVEMAPPPPPPVVPTVKEPTPLSIVFDEPSSGNPFVPESPGDFAGFQADDISFAFDLPKAVLDETPVEKSAAPQVATPPPLVPEPARGPDIGDFLKTASFAPPSLPPISTIAPLGTDKVAKANDGMPELTLRVDELERNLRATRSQAAANSGREPVPTPPRAGTVPEANLAALRSQDSQAGDFAPLSDLPEEKPLSKRPQSLRPQNKPVELDLADEPTLSLEFADIVVSKKTKVEPPPSQQEARPSAPQGPTGDWRGELNRAVDDAVFRIVERALPARIDARLTDEWPTIVNSVTERLEQRKTVELKALLDSEFRNSVRDWTERNFPNIAKEEIRAEIQKILGQI